MKIVLPGFKEKKGFMTSYFVYGLHKITVAVVFFTYGISFTEFT